MQILKETGIDWRVRILIIELDTYRIVKVRLHQGKTRSMKSGREVRQGCSLSPILFNLYSEHINNEVREGFADFKIGGQVLRTVKYADDLVLLAKEVTMLQGKIDRLNETERC
jgi:hypothetical protein